MEKTKIEYPMQDMMLGTKRSRIKGTGPRRHELKPFVKLGLAPHYVVKELNRILDTHTHNDIGGDNYNITASPIINLSHFASFINSQVFFIV